MKYFILALLILLMPFNVVANDSTPIEITADSSLEWNKSNNTFTASGNALIIQGNTSISAPKILANYTETNDGTVINNIIASPNAILIQPEHKLTADKFVAEFSGGELSTITATNNVIIKTDTETLFGNKAVYNAIKRTVIVTGNVRIEQDKNILTGDKAEFDLNTNISVLTASPNTNNGRVKATFFSKGAK